MLKKLMTLAMACGLLAGCGGKAADPTTQPGASWPEGTGPDGRLGGRSQREGKSPVEPSGGASSAGPRPPGGVLSVEQETGGTFTYQEVTAPEQVQPGDDLRVLVDVVIITAPAGGISDSDAFWEIASGAVGSARQQTVMRANGMRAGVMRAADWGEARAAIERSPSVMSQPAKFSGANGGTLAMGGFPERTIFYFDADGRMQGRSYEESEIKWAVYFAPEPGEPGMIRLSATPVVQSRRRHLRVTRSGQEVGLDYVQPEVVYEVGVSVVMPVGSAMALAPTADGLASNTSVARVFLSEDATGIVRERVMMFYPRLYRLDRRTPGRR